MIEVKQEGDFIWIEEKKFDIKSRLYERVG